MIALVEPCEKYLQSYIEAYDEYKKNNVQSYSFADARVCDIFKKYDDSRHGRNLKPNWVAADYYWLVDEDNSFFIGQIAIRHSLTDELKRYGGHIGYGVRFSEWNKGYGTLMLRLALEKAKALGITEALITCNDNNIASARVMENNGFVLKDKIQNVINGREIITRRYTKRL